MNGETRQAVKEPEQTIHDLLDELMACGKENLDITRRVESMILGEPIVDQKENEKSLNCVLAYLQEIRKAQAETGNTLKRVAERL